MQQKILVIDNDAGIRQVIAKVLAGRGYFVTGAEDGITGVEKFKSENPDAVLLDIRLSDSETDDILAQIKKINDKVPVIILAGFGDVEPAIDLVKKGAFNYISKPFKVDDLDNIIKKSLKQKTDSPAQEGILKEAETKKEPQKVQKISDKPKQKQITSKKPAIIASVLFVTGLLTSLLFLYYSSYTKEFKVSYKNPTSVLFKDNKIWIADWAAETIFVHDIDERLSVSDKYKLPDIIPSAIAYDGAYIWVSSSFEGRIYKLKAGRTLSIDMSMPSPGPGPSGLYYDGKYMWSLDFQNNRIYKHKMDDTLTVLNSFESPVKNPRSIFEYKDEFYISGAESNKIYSMRKSDFVITGIYIMEFYENGDTKLLSMGFDGTYIWSCSEENNVIFREKIGKLIKLNF